MINKLAVVDFSSNIGDNANIMEFAIIRSNCIIGKNVVIHPNVVIEEGVIIGDNVEIFPGAYIGKPPKGPGLARIPLYEKTTVIDSNCVLGPNSVIYYGTRIGNNCLISEGVSVRENCTVGNNCILGRNVTVNFNTQIGNNTKIMDLTHITGRLIIEDDVFIGPGVSSADDNSMGRATDYDGTQDKGATIKKGVSIGEGAVILPKVTIGQYTIIGAGAVVTTDIPEYVLAMGVPARVKKELEKQ